MQYVCCCQMQQGSVTIFRFDLFSAFKRGLQSLSGSRHFWQLSKLSFEDLFDNIFSQYFFESCLNTIFGSKYLVSTSFLIHYFAPHSTILSPPKIKIVLPGKKIKIIKTLRNIFKVKFNLKIFAPFTEILNFTKTSS